ncbi:MAG: B12-binding domain-containing radical SAM protein [Deltaproteobacteria bacterium]|nr:B12-binding domain-containing radical SAM protein [Deltaproteobacteria bacterium]
MHILLVNPAGNNVLHTVGVVFPPLGLLYVAAALRQNGHVVVINDQMVDHKNPSFKDFDVVGIYCDTIRFQQVMALARQAKASGARVVLGGPHPCFDARTVFASGHVDAIVRGEGERTMVSLLEIWHDGEKPTVIPGLCLKKPGGFIDGGQAETIKDVDSLLMPARDLVDLSLYGKAQLGGWPLTSMHTSRGCPFQCKFCASSQLDGAVWRARSAASVLDEMKHLVEGLGYRAIAFLDDNFAGSRERIMQICDGILMKGWKLRWWCFCRVDTILRYPDMISSMAEAGCFSIFVGVETPGATALEDSHKGIQADQARRAVEILKRNNIEIWASYILGFPNEIRRDLRATIRFARELDTNTAQFTILTPYPGTVLWNELQDRLLYRSGKQFDSLHVTFRHPRIPPFELQLWHLWAYISFYLRNKKAIKGFLRFLRLRRFGLQLFTRSSSKGKSLSKENVTI